MCVILYRLDQSSCFEFLDWKQRDALLCLSFLRLRYMQQDHSPFLSVLGSYGGCMANHGVHTGSIYQNSNDSLVALELTSTL